MEIKIDSHTYGEVKAIIDDEDFDYVNKLKWHPVKNFNTGTMYFQAHVYKNGKRTSISMHRYIMKTPDGFCTDHINHNGFDNRKVNLRTCTTSQNGMNRKVSKNNTTGYKGVTFNKHSKSYKAYIKKDNKEYLIGYYKTADQAAIAYNIAAVKYFGEFARPNDNIMMHKGFH